MRLNILSESFNPNGDKEDHHYMYSIMSSMDAIAGGMDNLEGILKDLQGDGLQDGLRNNGNYALALKNIAVSLDPAVRSLAHKIKPFPSDGNETIEEYKRGALAALQQLQVLLQGGIDTADQVNRLIAAGHAAGQFLEAIFDLSIRS